ncbi:MAG: hypothetical protein ABI851_16005 [Saprospiraceae bacterium]
MKTQNSTKENSTGNLKPVFTGTLSRSKSKQEIGHLMELAETANHLLLNCEFEITFESGSLIMDQWVSCGNGNKSKNQCGSGELQINRFHYCGSLN